MSPKSSGCRSKSTSIRLLGNLLLSCLILVAAAVSPICAQQLASNDIEAPPIPLRDVYKPGIAAAKEQLLRKLKKIDTSTSCEASAINLELAAYEYADEQYQTARNYLRKAKHCISPTADGGAIRIAVIDKHEADCALALDKFDEALVLYEVCLPVLTGSSRDALIEPVLESMSYCLEKTGHYDEALKRLQTLAEHQEQLDEKTNLGWTYLTQRDILDKQGKAEEAEKIFQRAVQAFKPNIVGTVEVNPVTPNPGDLWSAFDLKKKEPPLLSWKPDKKPVGALLCVHGMGLHKAAYTEFGKKMAERGYVVFSMDVRGFGAYGKITGQERIDLKACASDVVHVARAISQYNPGVPIFVVGESMGGAIALQAGCLPDCGGTISGIISSVPAAERYNSTETKLKVAWHFITSPHTQYDITSDVVSRVTANEKVVEDWKTDRESRLHLATSELVNFDRFMGHTKSMVRDLRKPVLVTQGANDKLVRPESTIELFGAIAHPDKTLILLGDGEHLIFEKGCFPDVLLDGIAAWMAAHSKPGSMAQK